MPTSPILLKLECLPPSVHMMFPVAWLIRYAALVLRAETIRFPSGSASAELTWK